MSNLKTLFKVFLFYFSLVSLYFMILFYVHNELYAFIVCAVNIFISLSIVMKIVIEYWQKRKFMKETRFDILFDENGDIVERDVLERRVDETINFVKSINPSPEKID